MAISKLIDLGEQGILTSIVFPAIARSKAGVAGVPDDCAIIELPVASGDAVLVATSDPCPRPVVFELFDADYWHYGWLAVVINVSDLAAMGAVPAGILLSTVMPDDMSVDDYSRFWDGVVAASSALGCKILGGNIKDGVNFTVDGTALGFCDRRSLMRRGGAADGDLIYVIGNMGAFWSAVLHRSRTPDLGLSVSEQNLAEEALTRPVPRLREGMLLAESGLVTACMDASDGVLGCLLELGRCNHVDVNLDAPLEPVQLVRKVAAALGIHQLKLMLAWGDWQLVVTIRNESKRAFDALTESTGIPANLIGRMVPGPGGRVFRNFDGRPRRLANLSSERFGERSYFTRGMPAYIEWFLQAPLLAGESAGAE